MARSRPKKTFPASPPAAATAPAGQGGERPLAVNGRRIVLGTVAVCLCLEILFVVLDATISYGNRSGFGMLRRMFNIAREDSLASWFSATQTWMVGLTAALLALASRRAASSRAWISWSLVAAFFLYMGMDDGAEIHERLGSAFKEAHSAPAAQSGASTLGARLLKMFPSYAWQVTSLPLFAGFGLFSFVFIWRRLTTRRRRAALVAGFACMALAVGLDFTEGLEENHPWNLYGILVNLPSSPRDLDIYMLKRFGEYSIDVVRHFSKSIEEFLEMLGNTLIWAVLLGHLAATAGDLTFRFQPPPAKSVE